MTKGDVVNFRAGTGKYKGIFLGTRKGLCVIQRGVKKILMRDVW